MTIPLITAPAAPRTPVFAALVGLDEGDGILVDRLVTVICEDGVVTGEDNVAVNDVIIVCCMLDVDDVEFDDPGKVSSGRVTPFSAHSWTIAAGKRIWFRSIKMDI